MKYLFVFTLYPFLLFLSMTQVRAGSFISNGTGGGNWNISTTWTYQNDSDGIPDNDDDILVLTADSIIWDSDVSCLNLVTEAGSSLNAMGNYNFEIYGNYHHDGQENGGGTFIFQGVNKSISGTGEFSLGTRWIFSGNYSIQSEVQSSKLFPTRISNGATITNYGNIKFNGLLNSGSIVGTWVNATGSYLTLRSPSINIILDASSFENTVKISYSTEEGCLPPTFNNTYHHLEIGISNQRVYLTDDFIILGNMTILSGGNFDQTNYHLHLKGDFHNYQDFSQDTSAILFMDGINPQTMNSYGVITALNNLVIDNTNGVTVGAFDPFTISVSLVIESGEFDLGKDLITLLSDSTRTAYIGESNGTLNGTMTIQRFISNRNDGYSDLSSPVNSAIFYDWTDDLDLAFGPNDPSFFFPTCWGYDESSLSFYAIETFNELLIPGKGYEIYLDNDGDTSSPFTGDTLDLTGTPNFGDITVSVTMDHDGWNLIGNPYPAPISWTAFRNNCGIPIGTEFQYYDENINDYNIGQDGDIIASGQGFWIQAFQSGDIVFHESHKVNDHHSSIRVATHEEFGLALTECQTNSKSFTFFGFNEKEVNERNKKEDVRFIATPHQVKAELVSWKDGKVRMAAIDDSTEQTIPLHFKSKKEGEYKLSTLSVESLYNMGYTEIILKDKMESISHDLGKSNYSFNASPSDDPDRFTLYLKKGQITSGHPDHRFRIHSQTSGFRISWENELEENTSILLYDLGGKILSSTSIPILSTGSTEIILPDISEGIYLIQIFSGSTSETFKIHL